MYDSKYTPTNRAGFGLHDAVEFLEGLDYDVSGLGNAEIMSTPRGGHERPQSGTRTSNSDVQRRRLAP